MKMKVFSIGITVLLVLSGIFVFLNSEKNDTTAKASTLHVGGTGGGNWSLIQDAIDNASAGDTVFVYNGLYNETLNINISLRLIGEDMYETIINGNFNGTSNQTQNGTGNQTQNNTGNVININADNVHLSNFTVTKCGIDSWDAGININKSKNCSIINCNISSNGYSGILLFQSSNITIMNNNVSSNKISGISLYQSFNITITNNNISFNYVYGISSGYSGNNTIINNSFTENGIYLSYSTNNMIENNVINVTSYSYNIDGIYLNYHSNNNSVNKNNIIDGDIYIYSSYHNDISNNNINEGGGIDLTYSDHNDFSNNNIMNGGGIYLTSSNYNDFSNNNIMKGTASGFYLSYSSYNNISNNVINEMGGGGSVTGGIRMHFSHTNIITNNDIHNNNMTGIYFRDSINNMFTYNKIYDNHIGINQDHLHSIYINYIYLNNIYNNSWSSLLYISNTYWNSSKPLGYIYNNTNFTNYLGNYWIDYTGFDNNSDGIGDTPHIIYNGSNVTEQDSYPLMMPFDNYIIIPTSIKVESNATSSNSTNITVSLDVSEAIINSSITGTLNGTLKIKALEIVTINSSYFAGKGFFKSIWTASIEGKFYQGKWHGMLFNRSSDGKIYLKGTVSGDMRGITDGYLLESKTGSGNYDLYNSTWTINQLNSELTFAQFTVNGSLKYYKEYNFSSEIYILQSSHKSNATGYYNGSLDIVLTHVRINNITNKYNGQGFSIITYSSKFGSGQGWTYDYRPVHKILKLNGFFTKPIWGLIYGTLDESGSTPYLTLTIVRIDIGLPPQAVIDMDIWGFKWVSPGQTVNYFISYKNSGLKAANNTKIVMTLPKVNVTYKSNTGGGAYNSTTHEVTWRLNISAKSKGLVSIRCKIKWGLTQGLKLKFNSYIKNYVKNFTLAADSFTSIVRTARDPNIKYGPDGYVSQGQTLNYTIEFENEGAGIAYGVYFTDELSENLNDSTLKIGPVISVGTGKTIAQPGTYNPETRTITWFVGEVDPGEGGFANISIDVYDNASAGTEILNYGTVYFPSVPEVTKTNGIVSIVWINKDPIASAGKNLVVKTLEEINFDGSASYDPDGTIENYTWDFGDGQKGYGKAVNHAYQNDGNFTVKLTVRDNWNYTASHEIYVFVKNRLPEAIIEANLFNVKTYENVTFTASKSSDLDGSVAEYYFDFGDGNNSGWILSSSINHQYSDGTKTYKAQLSVKDDDGEINTNVADVEITVNNRKPESNLTANLIDVFTYQEISFNAELSIDMDGTIEGYYFDFGDGNNSGWIVSPTINHQYSDGTITYKAQLSVKDDDGEINTNIAEVEITVNNRKPEPTLTVNPLEAFTYEEISFNAELSSDLDGTIEGYFFDFGDGNNSGWLDTPSTTHQYSDGVHMFTIELQVKDDDEETETTSLLLYIKNRLPTANAGINQVVDTNQLIHFDGSLSSDLDGVVDSYKWDFGDGTTGIGKQTSHSYLDDGKYTVTLTITDDDDAFGTDTCIITVNNVKPIANFTVEPEIGDLKTIFRFSSTSFDSDGTIVQYNWNFGDGNTSTEINPDHKYDKSDTYTVSLTVQDDDGLFSNVFKKDITVSPNLLPIIIIESSTTSGKVDQEITFDAQKSYDPDGELVSFKWQFGDGSTTSGKTVKHTYNSEGTYTVKLTVEDDFGNKITKDLIIDVTKDIIDTDGDQIPDNIDPDDDNDGLPDKWEEQYKFNKSDPTDAVMDEDNDDLTNLEEFEYLTDPTNADSDGEGLLDGEEIKNYLTDPNDVDTDDDEIDDKNDPYPNDPNLPQDDIEVDEAPKKDNHQFYLLPLIILIVIIILIIPIVLKKRRRDLIGRTYTQDRILKEVSYEILTDPEGKNLRISREEIRSKLDLSKEKGEISEETYKYINEDLLHSEQEPLSETDAIEK